ncbi:MAG: molybdenum cofactor guanylyltransferase [Phycisphaerales bacterium]|nr:molybdenum cofactor guanylyltransferase [Phycisphaerales bacterium]
MKTPEAIQPIVLVGGKSRRFGRDKLREPLTDGTLVERPIRALRDVFGPCVALVGECDASVAQHGDLIIPDRYPGLGPAGGILSAFEHIASDSRPGVAVFVLAGDLPLIARSLVKSILDCARDNPDADAIVARTPSGLEPCIGLYRTGAVPALRTAIAGSGTRAMSLQEVLVLLRVVTVDADSGLTVNVNRPEDLARPL